MDYAGQAREYLKPIRWYDIRIQSLKERIDQLEGDLLSLGAVDYSKERLSGGGTPTGLESGVAALVDAKEKARKEISQLVVKREKAVSVINQLPFIEWREVLTNTYIIGNPDNITARRMHYSVSRIEQLRKQALMKFGEIMP